MVLATSSLGLPTQNAGAAAGVRRDCVVVVDGEEIEVSTVQCISVDCLL